MYRSSMIVVALLAAFAATAQTAIPSSQRDALTAIYKSTNGPSWNDDTNWLGSPGSECTWAGVRCDDEGTTVTGLYLEENNLTGSLPPEIGNLPDLEELELYINAIGGTIPSSIGNLPKLRGLLLFDNQLSGSLPVTIGNLSALENLYLDRNNLTGQLPDTMGGLTSLVNFSANGNRLEGPLPSGIGQLVHVRYFDLSYNRIGGPLPTTVGMMAKVEYLYLNDNEISGAIPAEISGAASLVEINLSSNRLTGALPASIGSMPSLVVLALYNNQISGSIPPSLGGLAAVEVIDLEQNALSGGIPPQLGNLTTLRELWLSSNKLTGTIPPELGNIESLERIQLNGNGLTGSIPPQLGNLSNLRVLSLGFNDLGGTIPGELGKLKKLISLSAEGMSLEGTIPIELTGLTELGELNLYENLLTGSIPASIGNLTKMEFLFLGGNGLTGTIPTGVTNMREMIVLDLRGNTFTGTIPPDIGNLTRMVTLQMFGNALTGTIPSSIGACTNLEELRLGYNRLTGVIPPEIGNLTNLRELHIEENRLQGPLPPQLFGLTNLESLLIGANRFGGALPSSLGNLTNLFVLDAGHNAFRGEVPSSLVSLTNLEDGQSDFRYNALTTASVSVRSFLNQKQDGGDWESTQTVAPTGFRIARQELDGFVRPWVARWTPITYQDDEGGYRVTVVVPPVPPATESTVYVYGTSSKFDDSIILFDVGGEPSVQASLRSVTHPHGLQQNTIESPAVEFTSGIDASIDQFDSDIRIGTRPDVLVQEDSEPVNEVTYSIINVGELVAEVQITQTGDFFLQSEQGGSIEPGESLTVTVSSVSRPAGEYSGTITVRDGGVFSKTLTLPIKLVSSASTSGTAIAIPSLPRVDLSAARESNPTGSVAFTNVGDASLSGILESDVPWLVPQSGIVAIAPNEAKSVSFTLDRAQRPDSDSFAQDGAAFSGVLRLVYASGAGASSKVLGRTTSNGSGVSASLVTVVDSVKPTVSPSGIPALDPGEIGLVVPGVRSATTSLGTVISDLSIANAYGASGIGDLRVFYNASGGAASVAAFGNVTPRGSILLADAVKTVYEAGVATGVAQLRTRDANRLLVGSRLVTVRAGKGTYSTSLPVFRTNRGVGPEESIYLTGLGGGASRTDVVIQALGPEGAVVRVQYLDASGNVLSTTDPVNAGGWDVAELKSAVPDNAVTAIVTNRADSPSRVSAYAINWDDESGDSWIVADWSRYYAFGNTTAMKIPVARLIEQAAPRRRPVRRPGGANVKPEEDASEAEGDVTGLNLSIFNPDSTAAIGTLTFVDGNGNAVSETLTLQSRQTMAIENVLSTLFQRKGSANGYLTLTPDRGGFAVSARLATSGGGEGSIGSTVPVLAQASGLRLGQSQIFAGLEDTRQTTIDAKQGGTHRTQVGILETTGSPVTVRATMLFYDGKSLAATVRSRDFEIDRSEIRLLGNIARAIVGNARETTLGDLHDFQVEFRVVSGEGAVTIFTETFDNGTGDWVLRTE